MSDASRRAVAVSVLANDASARMLVLSWPLVPPSVEGREALVSWSRVSGVAIERVVRSSEVLFAHSICRPDRTVDPEAMRVVQHIAANYLRAKGGKQ